MDSIRSSSSVLLSSDCLAVRDTLFPYVASQSSEHSPFIGPPVVGCLALDRSSRILQGSALRAGCSPRKLGRHCIRCKVNINVGSWLILVHGYILAPCGGTGIAGECNSKYEIFGKYLGGHWKPGNITLVSVGILWGR